MLNVLYLVPRLPRARLKLVLLLLPRAAAQLLVWVVPLPVMVIMVPWVMVVDVETMVKTLKVTPQLCLRLEEVCQVTPQLRLRLLEE